MKPARSPQETACLPTLVDSARSVSATFSLVATVDDLDQLHDRGGVEEVHAHDVLRREVTLASEMIGRLEVVVARIAPGFQLRRGSRRAPS